MTEAFPFDLFFDRRLVEVNRKKTTSPRLDLLQARYVLTNGGMSAPTSQHQFGACVLLASLAFSQAIRIWLRI